jgi:hypothetical protein
MIDGGVQTRQASPSGASGCAALAAMPVGTAHGAREHLMASLRGFTAIVADDVTALLLRYAGLVA